MSEIAINNIVILIIAVIVLITLIIYFYYLYSSYEKSSGSFSSYTNKSMSDISLRMECLNKNLFSVQEEIENSLSGQCNEFDSVTCRDIFIEDNTPYYNCTVYCYSNSAGAELMCSVEYNCETDEAQLNGPCVTLS